MPPPPFPAEVSSGAFGGADAGGGEEGNAELPSGASNSSALGSIVAIIPFSVHCKMYLVANKLTI